MSHSLCNGVGVIGLMIKTGSMTAATVHSALYLYVINSLVLFYSYASTRRTELTPPAKPSSIASTRTFCELTRPAKASAIDERFPRKSLYTNHGV